MDKKITSQNILLYAVFVGYVVMMLDFLFLGRLIMSIQINLEPAERSLNLIPFLSIREDIAESRVSLNDNFLGNIFIFVPAGIYSTLFLKKKNIMNSMVVVFFTSLSVEVIQFITRTGAADIDDILLNCIGGLLGVVIYRIIANNRTYEHTKKVITICSAVFGIPVIALYIVLFMAN